MSKLILNVLKTIKPLIKANGVDVEKYALVEDGILYFNNGVIELEMPVDIPFNACVNLYELITVLDKLKGETVIVYQDDIIQVIFEDRHYNIATLPFDDFKARLHQFNLQPQVSCQAPQIFKQMCKIAETYVQPISDVTNITYTYETMIINDGFVICSDKFNIIQAMLDFGMPNGAYPLDVLIAFNKLAKHEIVGMGATETHTMILFENGLKVYLPNFFQQVTQFQYMKVFNALNSVWQNCQILIPDFVKTQLEMAQKISLQNVVFFNNTFCQAGNSKIEYAEFTDIQFDFKCLYKHLKIAFNNGAYFNFSERAMSFISDTGLIRGVIGKIQNEECKYGNNH